jgi:hypothetical protein
MRTGASKDRTESEEEVIHTELAGGRLGATYRTTMPVIKVTLTTRSVSMRLGARTFRIPLATILYVQTQKILFSSELKLIHSQPEVPAAVTILSFHPGRLLEAFSSLGIRVDDRAGVGSSGERYRFGAYFQLVGGLLLLVVGMICLVALMVWATKTFIVAAGVR